MNLNGINVCFALTGAFYKMEQTIGKLQDLVSLGVNVIPVMSFSAYNINTRYGKALNFIRKIENITNNKILHTFVETENLGHENLVDIMVIAPCTGNTLSKLANGIADTPVLMASKSVLRNNNSVVLGISTNDGLGSNAVNIGKLLNMKNIFLVPFLQDNPITKPNSLTFNANYIVKTIEFALEKKQIQPILM